MDREGGFEFALDAVRLDGWYRDFLATVADVEVLEAVFGRRGLGYLMLAGVRLESVALDRQDPAGSVVDVQLPDGRVARAPARLLVRRAIEALVEQVTIDGPRPSLPDVDQVRGLLGGRFVLLTAMHGISLRKLVVPPSDEPTLDVEHDGDALSMPISSLRRVVVGKLEDDIRSVEEVQIDEARIGEARAAEERGEHRRVIEILEPMAGPLVSLLRSGAAARMAPEERTSVVAALELLARAQMKSGDVESAETILRLGAQGCRGEPESAALYVRLGEIALLRGSAGEAIGALRRASALGAPPKLVGVPLASALASRGRHVAAVAVRDQAIADGALPESFVAVVASERELGDAYAAVRRFLSE